MMRIIWCVTDLGKYLIGVGNPPLHISLTQHDENAPSELDDIIKSPPDVLQLQVGTSGNEVTTAVIMFLYMHQKPALMQCMKVLLAIASDSQQAGKSPEVLSTVDAMLTSIENTFKRATGMEYPTVDDRDRKCKYSYNNIRNSQF